MYGYALQSNCNLVYKIYIQEVFFCAGYCIAQLSSMKSRAEKGMSSLIIKTVIKNVSKKQKLPDF
jgi:hypothetical protein